MVIKVFKLVYLTVFQEKWKMWIDEEGMHKEKRERERERV